MSDRWLWSTAPDHDGLLHPDEIRQVEAFLTTAGDNEPRLFEPGEISPHAWQLDIDAVLRAYHADAAAQ